MNILAMFSKLFIRYFIIAVPILVVITYAVVFIIIPKISGISTKTKREIKNFNSYFNKNYLMDSLDIFRCYSSKTTGTLKTIIMVTLVVMDAMYIGAWFILHISFKTPHYILLLLEIYAIIIFSFICMTIAIIAIYIIYTLLKTSVMLFHLPKRTHMRIRKSKEYKDEQ